MTVTAFPLYNLNHIPDALRQLANRIEHGEIDAVRCVVVMESSVGQVACPAFGREPFTLAHASGLCFAAAGNILE